MINLYKKRIKRMLFKLKQTCITTRLVESVRKGKTYYICEYKLFFFWRPCNDIFHNLGFGGSHSSGYPDKELSLIHI